MMKKIDIPIYSGSLVIHQYKDFKKIGRKLKWDEADDSGAFTYVEKHQNKETDFHMVFRKKGVELSYIAHEATHMMGYIFRHHGVKYDQENDEPAAYLVGWLVNKCVENLKLNQ